MSTTISLALSGFDHLSYLCIGHCCHDKTEEGVVLGGTASYCGQILSTFGISPVLYTSVGSDFDFADILYDRYKRIIYYPSIHTTLFENIETEAGRKQKIHQRASTLVQNELLKDCRDLDIVHFAPIANEIDLEFFNIFNPKTLKVATIQGWLRAWDAHKNVFPQRMDYSLLKNMDIVIMSEEDISSLSIDLPGISMLGPLVIKTKAEKGADIYEKGKQFHFPSIKLKPVQLVGAGDVFSTVFFIAYQISKDIVQAASWAHAAASIHIEGLWSQTNLTVNEIQKRAERYRKEYKV